MNHYILPIWVSAFCDYRIVFSLTSCLDGALFPLYASLKSPISTLGGNILYILQQSASLPQAF
jgi:hypothetical protein